MQQANFCTCLLSSTYLNYTSRQKMLVLYISNTNFPFLCLNWNFIIMISYFTQHWCRPHTSTLLSLTSAVSDSQKPVLRGDNKKLKCTWKTFRKFVKTTSGGWLGSNPGPQFATTFLVTLPGINLSFFLFHSLFQQ